MRELDPIAAVTLFLMGVLSPQVSQVLGPYAVIVLAAVCGAAWGLGRVGPMSRWGALWYFLKLILTAMILTVPLATGVQAMLNWEGAGWLIVPIALLIGGVGNDWPSVGAWVVSWLGRLVERRTGTHTVQKDDQP